MKQFLKYKFIYLFLLKCLFVVHVTVSGQTPVTYNTPGSYTYTVPNDVTQIIVQAWGAGGGGASANSNNSGFGGGGGGAYASSVVTVIPGGVYSVVVGSGGAANSDGGNSTFNTNSVIAEGGQGALDSNTSGGAGGTVASSVGTTRYAGGNGGNGSASNSGGGGGGAGSTGAGGNASAHVAGTGTADFGGNGAAGYTSGRINGANGSNYGGGGSGAIRIGGGPLVGGSGAGGLVIITPILPQNNVEVNATVGVASKMYSTLKAAFDGINDGTHQGIINIKIIESTTETASAILNASGTGSASYSTVTIYPTATNRSVTGNLAAPLIQLNGADNVRIDGRVNQAGSASLTINNTSTASGARTIEFINSAQNNTIEHCFIRGAGTSATQGTINFTTSTSGTGNDANFIQFNNITGVSAASRPVNAIYSAGTATRENSENTIRNNNIYDFLMQGTASNGIHIAGNSTSFTIIANSFYETTTFAPSAAVEHAIIRINNTSGGNFLINNNFIGGNATSASGTWTKTATNNNTFSAIHLNTGTTSSSVQGNTIRNFNYANSGAANWFGINVQAGNVNIGTVSGNTIGASTGTGSITFTAGATNASFNGIFVSGSNTVNVSNNIVGSITTNTSASTNACHFYGIFKAAGSGNITISNNSVGSTTTANSVQTASLATSNSQLLYAIYTLGTSTNTITGNTIANVTNATSETTLGSRVRGIFANAGSNTINNNRVQFLKTRGLSNGGNYANTALVGISLISTASGNAQQISGNTIHDLENNTTNTTLKFETYGIFYDGPSDIEGVISRNFIHTYIVPPASSTGHFLHGISLFGGSFIASNNIVFMGNNITVGCSLWGLWTNTPNHAKFYHNTIYLTGVAQNGTSNSYALRVLSCPASLDVRNNILWDGRTNVTNDVSHFSIFLNCLTNATVDYNNYQFAQQFGQVGATQYNTFNGWKTGTSLDANSLNVDPELVNLGGILPIDYQSGVQLQGINITGQTTDFDGVTRVAPTMGAWEFFPDPVEIWNGSVFRQAYPTLKAAFDAINAGTWTGNMTIIFRGNTTETATAVLNASGTGSSNYSRIIVYPGRSGIRVTGNLAAPIIDLNGARHVTFDGRVNGTGTPYEFTVTNTNTSATSGNSVVRFINSAQNDTLRYTVINGGSTATVGGNVYFATATSGTGNSNNVLFSNRISSVNGNRPVNAIYSQGSAAHVNTGNKIEANEIFNYFRHGTESFGIHIGANSSAFNILNNSFYETSSFAPTASVTHRVIHVNNTSGNNFSVSGNHIGGNSANSQGTWTKTNTFNNEFYAISMTVGTTTPSNVDGNIIRNFSYANSGAANWYGIHLGGGAVNVGTTSGNTIGALTGTGSVTVTNGATDGTLFLINNASTGTVNIENNVLGSVTAAAANGAHATNLVGIHKTSTAGATVIRNNQVGSASTANSIQTSSASTANAQTLFGIWVDGTGASTVNENTVQNLTNATTNTNTANTGKLNGIWMSNGSSNLVNANLIDNLTIANANNALDLNASIIGINLTGSVPNRTVSNNAIRNISNTFASYDGAVFGLYYRSATTGVNTASQNLIHSLTANSTSALLIGVLASQGVVTYSNNIIILGNNTNNTVYGFYDVASAGNNSNVYFNTIYIGGTVSGTSSSYAMLSAGSANIRNYRNNIFSNYRSGGSGNHFAIYYNDTNTNLTANYNNYWVSGTGGVIGYYPSANRSTLAALQSATGQDAQSLNLNPAYTSPGSIVANDYRVGVALNGIADTGIIIDYGNFSRPGTNPTMGAWERNVNRWKGSISTDWGTAGNWTGNTVPAVDATIEFDPVPERHCVMDQNRSVANIINAQGTYRVVTNGHKLTVKGALQFTNGAQIDARVENSMIEFAGSSQQTIPVGSLLNNEVYNLNINNASNVVLNGTLRLLNNITSTAGRIDLTTNGTNFVYAADTVEQTIPAGVFLNSQMHNLIIDNAEGVNLNTDITINNNLTINSGKKLNINPDRRMTVLGTVSNNGGTAGLKIRSNSTLPNGTFIFFNPFSNPVQATVEMYSKASFDLSQPVGARYNWQFFGIPVRSLQAESSFVGSFVRRKVEWGTTIFNHWLPLTGDSIMNPFVGYEVSHQNPKTIVFAGELVNHNFSSGQLPITNGAIYPGQHLFSNPYTAAIDIRQIEFGSGAEATAYMYNTGTFANWENFSISGNNPGQYVSVPKNLAGTGGLPRTVPSMGNILVKVSSESANDFVNFNYNDAVMKNTEMQRIKAGENALRTNTENHNDEPIHMVVEVFGDSGYDRMWLYPGQGFSRGYDSGYDGRKIFGPANLPQLFAIEKDGLYQVNAVDDIHNTALGLRAGLDEEYVLVFRNHDLNQLYHKIFLHDLVDNKMIDISEDGAYYEFRADNRDHMVQRFRIITQTEDEGQDVSELKIFSADKSLYLKNFSNQRADFLVYDLSGKLMGRTVVEPGSLGYLRVPNHHVCIVKAVTASDTVTKTIMIQQ